ncbi:MAG: hypothetical protein PHI64_17755 [Zoogloea sp.]|uniref:hypothetical protein n=1 Tax=Zoogloea sp. TaxID=49181 RepID=UPI0026316150|nr:hypothetical protein [Zoogloea sp.]MDD2990791.1 hypothetical protein [Zoogloea sp.]
MTAPHSDPRIFWRCSPGRRLPAYARDLADARARDLVPAQRQVAVYLDRWPVASVTGLGLAICCPPDFDPARLDWRYLAALSVLVVTPQAPNAERLRVLLSELVAVRPLRLVLLRPGGTPAAQFIVSEARGQEVLP